MACPENSEKSPGENPKSWWTVRALSNGKLLICMGRPVEKVPAGVLPVNCSPLIDNHSRSVNAARLPPPRVGLTTIQQLWLLAGRIGIATIHPLPLSSGGMGLRRAVSRGWVNGRGVLVFT